MIKEPKIILNNVFSKEHRKKLIEDCEPLLLGKEQLQNRFNQSFPPSKQTPGSLHIHPKFQHTCYRLSVILKKKFSPNLYVENAWINWNSGKKDEMCWHNHPYVPYFCIYYIKTTRFINNGTMYMKNGSEYFFRSRSNSMVIFPGAMYHSVPSYSLPFKRYTLAMDLNIF